MTPGWSRHSPARHTAQTGDDRLCRCREGSGQSAATRRLGISCEKEVERDYHNQGGHEPESPQTRPVPDCGGRARRPPKASPSVCGGGAARAENQSQTDKPAESVPRVAVSDDALGAVCPEAS